MTIFVLTVLFASYIQCVTGLAMAMLMVAMLGSARIMDVSTLTAVVSILSVVNILMSLHGHYHRVQGAVLKWMVLGLVPGVFVGLYLLELLSGSALSLLELMLGTFIVVGCMSMLIKPQMRSTVSSSTASVAAGAAGGILGGLFAASGPALGWFCYRQPLAIAEIRATLLGCFAVTTILRTLIVGVGGGLTEQVWTYFAIGAPIVLVGTWMGHKFPPTVSDLALRRGVFGLMALLGFWIIFSSLTL